MHTFYTITFTYDQIKTVSLELMNYLNEEHIMTFSGSLGAGKTTLIREMLILYGIKEPVTSPTFTYLNVYENMQGLIFYHFDLYRLKYKKEFLDAGFDEYLRVPNSKVLIEWPEIIMPLLKKNVCHVELEHVPNEPDIRKLEIRCIKKGA